MTSDPQPTRKRSGWPLLLLVIGVLVGSGVGAWVIWGREPELVAVTGKILYRGEPLTGGFVVSFPVRKGESALSALDETGHFDLSTNGVPGAAVGPHRLTVQAYTREMPPQPRIPAKYGTTAHTPLTLVVKKGAANHFEFRLDEATESSAKTAKSPAE
jgi:hypothetical protein